MLHWRFDLAVKAGQWVNQVRRHNSAGVVAPELVVTLFPADCGLTIPTPRQRLRC